MNDPSRAELKKMLTEYLPRNVNQIDPLTDALLTREREARRLALEEAAVIAETICQHSLTVRCSHGTAPRLIAEAIRARAKEADVEPCYSWCGKEPGHLGPCLSRGKR